ncbi:murein biosynthesis integral membrane protein MurJ [Xanthobacter autotrophicus]|uniref:murein biosynthesis integral membrane protein MurJ n=1 Tax=Xanthobacter autotrophicus TaxID=280 RepID=UPI0024A72F04|nr:lipid II flippase MurJ [Xanthobacter autotrophicus]MDI4656193.1 virulence factor MviN [Xanthobacter autotrophicus]
MAIDSTGGAGQNRAMSLLARTSIVSAATLSSRVLGFVRDAATAAVLGTGPAADALVAALALPLLARRLLSEGAFNLAFIPALAHAEGGGEGAPRRLAGATLALLFGTLLAFALLAALFMPQVIRLLAPGFEPGGARADVAVLCGRVAVLYLPFAGLAAIYGGVANGAHRVLLPALAPVAANLTVLAVIAVLLLRGLMESDTAAVAIAAATVAAGVSQLGLMVVAARGCPAAPGILPGGSAAISPAGWPWRKALGVIRAAAPAFLFAGLSQFRLIIIAAAVSASPGAVAALNYAQRLMDLPLGLVGASAGAVLVPALLRKSALSGAASDAPEASGRAMLAALAFALPAATGLAVLADPIVVTLFQRGSFDAEDAHLTGALLAILAVSLPAQGLERILSATASTAGRVKMAERVALGSLAVCLLSAFGLGLGAGPRAAAGAAALSAFASLLVLGGLLVRAGALVFSRAVLLSGLGLVAASLLMGGCVGMLAALWPAPEGQSAAAVRLAGLVASGAVVYGTAAWLLKALLPKLAPQG